MAVGGLASQVMDMPDAPSACSESIRKSIKWGVATSSFQIEGAPTADGKSPSIWDTFAAKPGNIYNGDNADVANNHYILYKQDVQLMKTLGIKNYRLSLSWPRIVPGGSAGSNVNHAGIGFYKRLLQELQAAGIKPMVTLFHWDLPQVLQDKYGGFTDSTGQFVNDFAYYADVAVRELGPWVTQWLTFNEPLSICQLGYGNAIFAPGISGQQYSCGHNLLLAHAAAAKLIHAKYPGKKISMALSGHWGIPISPADAPAAENFMQFQFGWMADPVYKGDYPASMRTILGSQLPHFTPSQKSDLAGSMDFFALNYYTSHYVKGNGPNHDPSDQNGNGPNGQTPGPLADVGWLFVHPEGMQSTLKWISNRYGSPSIWITENGVAAPGESALPLEQALQDDFKVNYFKGYIDNVCQAAADGVKVKGYFAWSLMDNFEWREGYRPRFGIVYVDFATQARYPKKSALWLSKWFFQPQAFRKIPKVFFPRIKFPVPPSRKGSPQPAQTRGVSTAPQKTRAL